MAPPSTVHRLHIALSDVDRNVYETLDLRLARHPSETMAFMLTRALAYALSYEPGIEMGPGLAEADEPAMRIRDAQGSTVAWIEVGTPSADRLHRASKACPRVEVFTHHDPKLVLREAEKRDIHRAETVLVHAVPSTLLSALEPLTGRATEWELTRNDGQLYVKVAGRTVESAIVTQPLVAHTA